MVGSELIAVLVQLDSYMETKEALRVGLSLCCVHTLSAEAMHIWTDSVTQLFSVSLTPISLLILAYFS